MSMNSRDNHIRPLRAFMAVFIVLAWVYASDGATVVVEFEYDASQLDITNTGGFTDVLLPGCDFIYRPGAPALPVFAEHVGLPDESVAVHAEARSKQSVRLKCAPIRPVQPPAILGLAGAPTPIPKRVGPDPEIYEAAVPFPANLVEFRGGGNLGGVNLAALEIQPVQYDPGKGELVLHTRIEVSIAVEPELISGKDNAGTNGFSRLAKRALTKTGPNSQSTSEYQLKGYAADVDPDQYQFIIITETAQGSPYTSYANWKTSKGVPAIVKTVEWIDSAYSGRDLQEKIRNFIKDARSQWGTSYVLLGGDIDAVPCRLAWAFDCETGNPEANDIPCDLYYSDLDGTWDDNGNDVFGELTDNIDLYPDVFVGRLPTRSSAEAEAVINKLLTYEKTPVAGYAMEAFFFAEILWTDPFTDSGIGKDMIADRHFADYEPIERRYETLGNETVTSVWDYLNWGPHLANHAGHGSQSVLGCGNGYFTRDDASSLENGPRYFVLFSTGCWTAALDYYSIGEDFVNNPNGGAIAFVGNSRYGWGSPGNPGRGYSDTFDSDFYGAILSEGLTGFGEAVSWPKISRIPYSQDENVYRCHQYQVNLLGDPELNCHTSEIAELTLDVPAWVPGGVSQFTATVTDSFGPVADARLCLSGYDVYQVGVTDQSGQVVFNLDMPESGILTMTATAPNHSYVQESLPVSFTGSFLGVTSTSIDDDSLSPSSGTGDGEMSAGETIELYLTVQNFGYQILSDLTVELSGGGEFATILNPSAAFGAIGPGRDRTNQVPLVFAVSDSCPPNHIIPFSLCFEDGGDAVCVQPLHLQVTSPKPEFRHYYADELIGDGDGIVDPGETIDLAVTVSNEGTGDLNHTAATLVSLSPSFTVTRSYASADTCVLPGEFTALLPPFEVCVEETPVEMFYGTFRLDFEHDEGAHSDTFLLVVGSAGFSDNMEDGEGGWTHSGAQDLWHISDHRSHSGQNSWYCGNPGTHLYSNNTDASLFSPFFLVPENGRLSFWCYLDVPVFGTDGLYVEIYNYGEWETVDCLGSGGALDSTLFLCGWAEHTYDLTDYNRGSMMRARFRMVTDAEDREEGFYIDDVSVYSASPTSTGERKNAVKPKLITLSPAWPNPAGGEASWGLTLPEEAYVEAAVYDIRGRLVRKLCAANMDPGYHSIVWDGSNAGGGTPSGVYFLRLKAGEHHSVRKVVRMRN